MSSPAKSPYLKTAPASFVECYEMAVIHPLYMPRGYKSQSWIRVTNDQVADTMTLAAGIRVERPKRRDEDDGA